MKKLFSIAILTFAMNVSYAQTAREEIHGNIHLSASNYLAYIAPDKPLTKALRDMNLFI